MPIANQESNQKIDCVALRRRAARLRRRRRRQILRNCLIITVLFAVVFVGARLITKMLLVRTETSELTYGESGSELFTNEKLRAIQTSSVYPKEMVEFAEKYEQVIDYVYKYPKLKDTTPDIDLSAEASSDSVPLLMQWDSRWGYVPYGNGLIGYTGCGPTTLSLVALYLTRDAQWTPKEVAEFASKNGYCVPGKGSSWKLISEGCQDLGLAAEELPLSESIMKAELDKDNPIIIVVGPGDFTYSGHFLVITGYDETGFTLNDPNSRENSAKTWSYKTLSKQIRNLWAMSKA